MTIAVYQVQGMTCEHCVRAVTEELSTLSGVTDISIELNAGSLSAVHVTSSTALDEADVRAAVDEAGYELVS